MEVHQWVWAIDDDLMYTTRSAATCFGVDVEKAPRGLPTRVYFQAIAPEDREKVEGRTNEVLERGCELQLTYTVNAEGVSRRIFSSGRLFPFRNQRLLVGYFLNLSVTTQGQDLLGQLIWILADSKYSAFRQEAPMLAYLMDMVQLEAADMMKKGDILLIN